MSLPGPAELRRLVERVEPGWSEVVVDGRRWGLTRSEAAGGRAIGVYAEELGGSDVVSANVYLTGESGAELRPCEMPAEKVVAFLREWVPVA